MPDPSKMYRWLLNIFPAGFREEYQAPMERQFRDDYRDAGGWAERFRLWVYAILDLAASAPGEIARELRQDLRYALRVYRSRSLSATLAIVALGLAIGASTGVFSVLNALLLRRLPFTDPDRLVELRRPPVSAGSGRNTFLEWRQNSPYLSGSATFTTSEMNLQLDREALRIKVAETSSDFFELLGTTASWGRTFAHEEDLPGRNESAVISHGLWQQAYGGDPGILGSKLLLNGRPLTIVGVAPPRFDYPGKTSAWVPTVFDIEKVPKRGAFLLQTIGRLKPGTSMRQADELFEAEIRRLQPKSLEGDAASRAKLISLRDQLAGPIRKSVLVLWGVVFFVLLAACANVAQLVLSRTTERQQELGVRAALGASRARLVQQLITEGTSLTSVGAALGLVVAYWVSSVTSWIVPAQLATQEYTIFDWHVVAFAAALAIPMGVLFGVIPAWLIGGLQPQTSTVRSHSAIRDPATNRTRAVLIALQAALTLILLIGSVTMGRTFLRLLNTELGFRPSNIVTMSVSLQGTSHRSGPAEWQYYNDALARLRALPGVEAAGAAAYLPLVNNVYMALTLKLDSGQQVEGVVLNSTMPGYFRTMGTKILAGREFENGERQKTEPAVVVNQAFATQSGLGTAIVGRHLISPWSKKPYVVVGVVDTARLAGPAYPGGPQAFWPVEEEPPPTLTFVAKVQGQAEQYLAASRDALRAVDPKVSIYDVKTMEERLDEVLSVPRFYTTAILFFAGLAVLLALIGIFGVASSAVARRRHEIGIRIALGATRGRVRTMVIRECLVPVGLGIVIGIAGALATGTSLESLVERTEPLTAVACMSAAGVLLVAALLSAWRATAGILKIDPIEALRAE